MTAKPRKSSAETLFETGRFIVASGLLLSLMAITEITPKQPRPYAMGIAGIILCVIGVALRRLAKKHG